MTRRAYTGLAVILGINAFFGISEKTTQFFFPEFGTEVFDLVRFYLQTILVFGLIVVWYAQDHEIKLPEVPSIWHMILNFTIFFVPSFVFLAVLFTGKIMGLPDSRVVVEQAIVAFDENLLGFILLPVLFPFGKGVEKAREYVLIKFADYKLRYRSIGFEGLRYPVYALVIMTMLHAGAYAVQVSTFQEFYAALVINFLAFGFMWILKESFGYGSCVAFHLSWNLVQIGWRGSII